MTEPTKKPLSPTTKLLIELGPLVLFFVANARFGIFVATGVFMATILIALGISWHAERRLPPIALVAGAAVLVFGGLTLWLHDEEFIKLKVTLLNGLFAGVLLTGLLLGKPFLKTVLGAAIELTDAGWRALTIRWILFFVGLALLNEYIRHSYDTDAWVKFKSFGILPLTFLFTLAQVPLMKKHALVASPPPE